MSTVNQERGLGHPPPFQVEAVVVLYHPDPGLLAALLAAVAPQVACVTLITNDGGARACPPLPDNAALVDPGRNLGLGAAYNLAAAAARARGATHLLLLDQDSVPAAGMVGALLRAFDSTGPVAAAGPLWRDRRGGEDGFFVRLATFGIRKFRPPPGAVVPVDFLISSGSLISLAALAEIGPFDAELFIDQVDTDWAFRARARGWRLRGVADARLDHAFGQGMLAGSVFTFGRRVFLYPPERNYYLLRNSLILWRRPHAPWPWILYDVPRTIVLMLVYALFVPPRRRRLACMVRALRDACGRRSSTAPKSP